MTRRHALLPAVLALVLWGCYVQPVVHEHSPPSPENVPVAIPADLRRSLESLRVT